MSFIPLTQLTHSHHHSHKHTLTHGSASNHHSSSRILPVLNDPKRGCENCPSNKTEGIHKVLGKVEGKRIFIFAQNPGAQENKERMELFGPAGKFLWKELKRVGIKREHCDIQNVVRCWTVDIQENTWPRFRSRAPNKSEIKCCSIYNEQALRKSRAKLYLIFGQPAGKQILKKEFSPATKRVFFSDNLKAWVVYLDHPAYFIRMGYSADEDKAPNIPLTRFREDLQKVKQLLKKKGTFDKFGFIKDQEYIGVTSSRQAIKAYHELKKQGESGTRLVVDMESGKVDKHGKPDDSGKEVALACGFCAVPGKSYTFALEHPDAPISSRCRHLNKKLVLKLIRNKKIRKSAHYAVADDTMTAKLLGSEISNLDYDTLLGEFFRDPDAKAYGLANTAARRFPDFMGYKDIRWPEAYTEEYRKKIEGRNIAVERAGEAAESTGKMNLARLPWKKMVLYNGADCHLEKLIEISTKKYVNMPLMGVYLDASFILARMERDPNCQPLFDYEWNKKLSKVFAPKLKRLARKLRHIAGKYAYVPKRVDGKMDWRDGVRHKVRFNPNSPDHLNWLVYDKMHIPVGPEGRNTRKGTLNSIAIRHKRVRLVPLYNAERKVETTYLVSYKKCADLNDGHLRTNWKLTGTGTGRLSSGATKDRKNLKVINLQNVHGDPLIKCQLISDKRWRKLYDHWREYGDFTEKTWKRFKDYYVQLGFDFSQNELREIAEESGDKNLAKAFAGGRDPHVEVGHDITGWDRELIAHDDRVRRVIKSMHFGIVFGLQGEGLYKFCLAVGAKTTRHEVDRFHRNYFRKYPGVGTLQKKYRAFAEKHNYVINPYGFRRNVNVKEQKEAEEMGEEREGGWWGNKAINTPIQSAAHHFLSMALAMLRRNPKKYRKLQHPQLEVHDALYMGVKLKYLIESAKLGHKLMVDEPMRIAKEEFGIEKKVPLATKPKAGFRFGVHIEGLGGKGMSTVWEFLNVWCRANRKLEHSYLKQLESK